MIAVLGGLALMGIIAAGAGAKVKKRLEEIKFIPVGVKRDRNAERKFATLPLRVIFNLENPNVKPIQFEKFSGQLMLNGTVLSPVIARPQTDYGTMIPGKVNGKNGQITIDCFVRVSLLALFGQALSILNSFSSGSGSVTFRITGKLSAAGLNDLPVDSVIYSTNN